MTFWTATIFIITYFFQAIFDWIYIFISPIHKLNLLWIIIPIWASWFFAEFFQEKKGTSFGNAISNGVVPLFIGFDWIRYLVSSNHSFTWSLFSKYIICSIVIIYGFLIIFYGIKGKKFIHYFGRIREVTYILLIFSPIIYDVILLTWRFIVISLIFFPLFYYLIELITKFTPDPEAFKIDEEGENETRERNKSDNFENDLNFNDLFAKNNNYKNNNINQNNNNNNTFNNQSNFNNKYQNFN
ncbi:MAG: hypothetical protein AB7V77_03495 [Candidatus Woesearchaeota archaeon]